MDPGPVPPELMIYVDKWILVTVMCFFVFVATSVLVDYPSTVNTVADLGGLGGL